MSTKKLKPFALLRLATLPVTAMLCAALRAVADTYLYPLTGSTWYLNQVGSNWYDKDTLSTYTSAPPGDNKCIPIIGDFGQNPGGPSNTTVDYDYFYPSTKGVGVLEIDNGNTLSQTAGGTAMVSFQEALGFNGTGAYTQSAGSNTFSDGLHLGYNPAKVSSSGTYTLSDSGALTGTGSANEYVGEGGNGSFTQTGGVNTVGGELFIGATTSPSGNAYTGTYSLNGGTLDATSEQLGPYATATFTQVAGLNTTNSLILTTVGNATSYSLIGGTLNPIYVELEDTAGFTQTGGTFTFTTYTQNDSSTSSFSGAFNDNTAGQSATLSGGTFFADTINVGTGATFTQTGGTLTFNHVSQPGGTVTLSSGINVAGSTYYLSGGSLSVPSITRSASTNNFTWTGGGLTLTSQAFAVTNATSETTYGAYIYGTNLTLASGMSLNITGGAHPLENLYGSGNSITQQTGSSNTTTSLNIGSTGSLPVQYTLNGGSLTATAANIGYYTGEGGSGFAGTFTQGGGTAQFGTLSLGSSGTGTYILNGGSTTVTNVTNLNSGASLQLAGGSFTTGSFFGPGSHLTWTAGPLTLTNQQFDLTTTTDPTYNGFIYGSSLTLGNAMALNESGAQPTVALFGSGSTLTQNTGSFVGTPNLTLGSTGIGAAAVQYNLIDGGLNVSNDAIIGDSIYTGAGAAYFTQSGGSSSFKTLDIAESGTGGAVFTLSSGPMTVTSKIDLYTNGTFHQSGGTLTFPTFNQTGGTANFDKGLNLTASTYTLAGGALTTPSITGSGSKLTWTAGGALTLGNQFFDVTTATSDTRYGGFIVGSSFSLNNGMSLTIPSTSGNPEEYVYGNGSSVTQNTGSTNNAVDLLMGSSGTGTPAAVTYTLAGGALTASGVVELGIGTLYSGPEAATFTQSGGTATIGTLQLDGSSDAYSISSGTLTVNSSTTVTGGTLTQTGGTITSPTTTNNGTITLTMGTATLGPLSGTGSLIVGGGSSSASTTVTTLTQGSLAVNNMGKLSLLPNSNFANSVTTLFVTGNGQFDVANNTVTFSDATTQINAIKGYVNSGYNGGLWTGRGINSSKAALAVNSNYGVGYAAGSDGVVAGLAAGTDEVKYALLGDANLDNKVDFNDFQLLARGFGKGASWDQGNFNYDATTDFNDFQLLARNFGANAVLTGAQVQAVESFALASFGEKLTPNADGVGFSGVAVPEPACVALIGMSALGLTRRKRRQ